MNKEYPSDMNEAITLRTQDRVRKQFAEQILEQYLLAEILNRGLPFSGKMPEGVLDSAVGRAVPLVNQLLALLHFELVDGEFVMATAVEAWQNVWVSYLTLKARRPLIDKENYKDG